MRSIETLLTVSVEPLLLIDEQGSIQNCNVSAAKLLPKTIGSSLLEFVNNPSAFEEALEECIKTDKPCLVENISIQVDGRQLKFTARLNDLPEIKPALFVVGLQEESDDLNEIEQAVKSNDERVERLSHELITVSKQLLEKTIQLGAQKNKLATIINAMAEGLLGCDENGDLIHVNENARLFLTMPEGDLNSKPFAELCPEIASAIRWSPHSPATVSEHVVDVSFGKRELRIRPSCMVDKEMKPMGFVLIIQDRTQEVELDHMKSDIISIVSHELRSPLTSIKGYVDLMMAGDLGEVPEHMKGYLDIVSSNANRLATLIDDMLDLSRIESGKLHMSFGKVDVKYLCDYVYLTMKPQAEKKEQQLGNEAQPGLTISGDMDRLQQALTNLVSNAIKYTPEQGEVKIQARTSDDHVTISVIDNGFGISEDDQRKLFQKFFRVKNEKTRNIGGTGLGLCITRSIIEAHEGTIEIESEPGKGSKFQIHLPLYLS